VSHFLINKGISANMRWNDFKIRRPLITATRQTEETQLKLLEEILRENAQTEFGLAHNFASISNMDEYRKNVPVHEYDQLAPLINRQMDGEPTLTTAPPLYYARTSGTTGRYKDIPLTHHGLKQVKHAQKHLAISLWRDTNFMAGSILGFASPAEEGRLKNGLPFGSMSGSTYKSVSPILAKKFVLPPSAFSIEDLAAKYQAYALAVLATQNLTGIVTANPSSILKLVRLIESNLQNLLKSLAGERTSWLLPEALAILPEIRARSQGMRITELNEKFSANKQLNPHDIWPKLSTIATWTGGSCGIAIDQLKRHLPGDVRFVEFGYGASEFMGSANVDARNNICLPLLNHHVYEFVKRADWEAETHRFVGLHELEVSEDYYIFITNRSGLYRYNINDIVRAERGLGDCPAITFIQKGRGVTNITGEKLSEYQLIEAVNQILADHQIEAGGFMALADETNSCYRLYLEYDAPKITDLLAQALDGALRTLNSEYDDKRESGRLQQSKVIRFRKDACETIKDWSLKDGIREAQYKPTVLAYSKDWSEKLSTLVEQE
jgi:hypothetical protein